MGGGNATPLADRWALLEDRFNGHAEPSPDRYRHIGRAAALHMWRNGTNETGEQLSQFERAALTERYCELFGSWPE